MQTRIAMLTLHTGPLDQPGAGSSGGMNVYVRELSRALAEMDVAVDVYTRSAGGATQIEYVPGVRVISVPAGRPGPVDKAEVADMLPALISAIDNAARDQGRYDLVHSHYWISGVAGQRLADSWNLPHIHMFHTLSKVKTAFAGSPPDPRREHAERRLLQAADAIVVSNPVERAQIQALYGEHGAPLISIPCGIDISRFSAARRHDLLRPHGDQFNIVALGRLEKLKNFSLLLEGLALAVGMDAEFAACASLTLAGGASTDEPKEAPRLKALAARLGLSQHVSFAGAVANDAVPALYAQADVCVVPSLHESFGLVALEAMASGVPVIATRTGGLQTTVINGVSGYLIDPQDPMALAEKLLALWRSPVMRMSMGMHGVRAAQHYAWPVIADRILCLYESMLNKSSLSSSL